jgi:hypothetical protein
VPTVDPTPTAPEAPTSAIVVRRLKGGERTWSVVARSAAGDEDALRRAAVLACEIDAQLAEQFAGAGQEEQP